MYFNGMSNPRLTHTINLLTSELNRHADRILRREFQLTYSQFEFLVVILELQSVSVGDLAAKLAISQPAVSKKLPWFVERDLIKLGSDPKHKTKVLISLTRKGSGLAKESARFLEVKFREAMASYRDAELNALTDDLQNMLEILIAKKN